MSYSNQTSAVIIKSEIKDLIEKDFTGEKRNQIKPGPEMIDVMTTNVAGEIEEGTIDRGLIEGQKALLFAS